MLKGKGGKKKHFITFLTNNIQTDVFTLKKPMSCIFLGALNLRFFWKLMKKEPRVGQTFHVYSLTGTEFTTVP